MTFFLLINIKMSTIVVILIFISRKSIMLSSAVQAEGFNCWYSIFHRQNKFHPQLSWAWKKYCNLGPISVFHKSKHDLTYFKNMKYKQWILFKPTVDITTKSLLWQLKWKEFLVHDETESHRYSRTRYFIAWKTYLEDNCRIASPMRF